MLQPTLLFSHPVNLGELLDGSITLYRKNFLSLVGIAAVVSIPNMLVQIVGAFLAFPLDLASFTSRSSATPLDVHFLSYYAAIVFVALLSAVVSIFQNGALAVVASEFFLGRRAGIKASYRSALRRGWSLLGAAILFALANGTIVLALIIPFIGMIYGTTTSGLTASSSNSILALLVLCLCAAFVPAIVLAVILNLHWLFWTQAVVLEDKGARTSLGRSWNLVRGSFWRVLLITVILNIFLQAIFFGPALVGQFGGQILFAVSPALSLAVNSAISTALNTLITPFRFAVLTLLYYDLRIRKEGFDLQFQAQQIAGEAA